MPASRATYSRINWVNKRTKLNQTNLNQMDEGIKVNNDLAKENANFIDEIFAALIEQLSVTYNVGTHTFHLGIGSSSGANPTTRFNVSKNVVIDTKDVELSALITGLNNGTTIVSRVYNDESGNNIKATYASDLDLETTFDGVSGQFVLTLRNKNGAALATKTLSIPLATTSVVGLLSPQDKVKINNIATDIATALASAKTYANGLVLRTNLVSILGEATTLVNGLMSTTDKQRLNTLFELLGQDGDANEAVDKISEVLSIFNNYPEGANLVSALAAKCNVADIIDALNSYDSTKPLSANQGRLLKSMIDDIVNGTTVVGKANKDRNGDVIDDTYMKQVDWFALGIVAAADYNEDTGMLTLVYDSNTVFDCDYDDDTGIVTFTFQD